MEDYLKQDFFNISSTDSMTWMENADFLKLSADLVYESIVATFELYKKEKDKKSQIDFNAKGINWKQEELILLEDKLKAYSNSYYLLIGYSFENLIKGLSIEKNPSYSFNQIFIRKWKDYKMGHGITEICKENFNGLSENEIKLLERLESYILWIGKYPVAKKIENHVAESENKYFYSNDKDEIDKLFEKIKLSLIEENKKNGC
jgi:hypothetical protein